MSVKIMGIVWELDIPPSDKFVLMAYADHADHDGNNVFPSIALICRKTGYSRRGVQNITRRLVDANILIPKGGQKGGQRDGHGIPAKWSIEIKGALDAPYNTDKGAPEYQSRAHLDTDKGAPGAPEPSVNHQKQPSVKRLLPDFKKEWDRFVEMWAFHLPKKPQPRYSNDTLKGKLKTRLQDDYFKLNYERALEAAGESDFIDAGAWFDAGWFLKNGVNWERCFNGNYKNGGGNGRKSQAVLRKEESDDNIRNIIQSMATGD